MPKKEIWLDRVYQQGRAKAADAVSAKVGKKITNLLAIGPDLAYLLVRLMMDSDVVATRKLEFAFSTAYVFLPIDIIPDKFPILGKIDDVYMILSSVAKVLRTTDREVLMRYWQGDPELMDKVRNILIKIDEKLGSGLTGSVLRYVEKATAGAVPA